MFKKIMTMTRLPGSPTDFLESLRRSFSWIQENNKREQVITILSLSIWIRDNLGWEKSSAQAARFIRTIFLTTDEKQNLRLTDWIQNWLAIEDSTIKAELLFEYLDDRIFFFGEILDLLYTPKNSIDLLDIVLSSNNHISWNSPGLLSSRLDWLMACGKINKLGSLYCLSPIVHDDKETVVKHYRENLDIGEKGEQFVLAYEKESLKDTPHLASRVRRVSLYAPRAGYDVQSYFPDGQLKFIEVKATPGNDSQFEMSHNEWLTAKRLGDSYFIYRITKINDDHPNIVILRNPVRLNKKPLVWKMNYSNEFTESAEDLEVNLKLGEKRNIRNQLRLETLLQELPIEESVFVSSPYNPKFTYHNKIYIKWGEDDILCQLCSVEDKPIIRLGLLNKQYYQDLSLCVDCFMKFYDLLTFNL